MRNNTIRLTVVGFNLYFFYTKYKNSVRTSQETHYVSATKPKQLMLFKENSLFVVRNIRNIQTHCVGKIKNFTILKQVVHIVTTGL
jgi:hypothetical protein